MRIEIILDLRAQSGLSLGPVWKILVDGKSSELPLASSDDAVERLVSLGVDPAEARWHASCLTQTTPYYEFELPPARAEQASERRPLAGPDAID